MSKGDKSGKKKTQPAGHGHATPVIGWKIQQSEYDQRVERVRDELAVRNLDALVVFHPIRMAYLSGFFHLSTERPMAIVVSAAGGVGALIPQLEQEHIAKSPAVTNVKIYPEYPTGGTQHPMNHLADLLAEMKLNKPGTRIGADNNGGLDVNGYDGPGLSDVVAEGVEVVKARDLVDKLRAVKSPAELAFIIEATVWGNLAHRLMQERLALGCNEMNVANEASMEASRMMIAALGPTFQPQTRTLGMPPANASYSAGANTSLPHGLSSGAGLRRGDVLVTYAGSEVGGYTTELERTMIVGEPSAEFRERFEQMLALQQVAFDALRPGRALAEVEEDVSNAFKEMGLQEHQRHHTGHGIGLEGHEAPFIDKGDPTVVAENMVFSVEPGLYIPGLAGFRHSDTVVITPNGCERLTYYPRDLESMTVHL
jgi:Xaa-Pro aminopeptidase